jgi:predicted DNA binding CopG/RHH family protein
MTDFRYTPATVKKIRRHALTMKLATIAAFMRCPVDMVEMICRKHEISTRDDDALRDPDAPGRQAVKKSLEIQIDNAMLRVVKREGSRRGLDTHTLIERLIEKIAEDGLFGAVLDR